MRWLFALTMLLLSLSYGSYQTRTGAWVALWEGAALTSFAHDAGFSYVSPTGVPEQSSHDRPSPAAIYEDGVALGPGNVSRESIQQSGGGRYAFWHDTVYFSASDNSHPARNGRAYTISYPPVTRTMARSLYAATALGLAASALALIWLVQVIGARRLLTAVSESPQRLRHAMSATPTLDPSRRRRIRVATLVLWTATLVLVALCETAFLTRTGQWLWLWQEVPISDFQPESGFAFVAPTGRPEIGSQSAPQPTGLFENGVQLGLRNSLHSEIREVGQGRYSFWHDYVIFATSDNSDPRTNGRRYTMWFPPISRNVARGLYLATLLVFGLTIAVTWTALRSRAFRVPPTIVQFGSRHALPLLAGFTAVTLVLPALLRSSPAWGPLVDDLWILVLGLHLAIALGVRLWWGASVPKLLRTACLVALGLGFAALTWWSPNRTQGCHTNGAAYPVWTAYCVAPDSASYYMGYTVGSTRQPLYPWFIDAVTAGSGFVPRQFLDTVKPGAPRFEADPLFRVVRLQITLLLGAALLACAATMSLLGSTLPAVVFLWLYDMQYLSSGELNLVLTEPLVQIFTMLLVAAFAAFLARRRPWLLLAAGAACGLAYLTRQAALYSAVMLGTLLLIVLAEDARRWWKWGAGALLIFVALCAVPDVYVFVKTGDLARQQTHLQYQYRIAHAMQYASPEDVVLMPDDESRDWLADAIVRRDAAHRRVAEQFRDDELNRMIYDIAANLYEVATPIAGFAGQNKTPEFYMKVATPILQRHWREYASFSFRFWQFGLTRPGLSLLAKFDLPMWYAYAMLFGLVIALRSAKALAAGAMLLAHWGAVAIICLAAVPIPRMINASEYLVVVAAAILIFESIVRYILPWMTAFGKETA